MQLEQKFKNIKNKFNNLENDCNNKRDTNKNLNIIIDKNKIEYDNLYNDYMLLNNKNKILKSEQTDTTNQISKQKDIIKSIKNKKNMQLNKLQYKC